MNQEILKKEALQYAERGWLVIPLHSPFENGCSCGNSECKSVGKHPRTLHGLKDAAKDPEIIKKWWATWPNANIGIVTGIESGIVALDIDPRHGGDESLEQLIETRGKLPETLESLTGGGGKHILFLHPGEKTRIRNKAGLVGLRGLDLRGDGGYIVAPPSLHALGKTYEWELSSESNQIARMPDWLIQIGSDSRFTFESSLKPRETDPFSDKPDSPESNQNTKNQESPKNPILDSSPILEGGRNNALISLAGTMRNRGMGQESILAALMVENEAKNTPPLTENEVRGIVKSIMNYSPSLTENQTELGNAKRLVSLFGHKIKYVPAWGKWLIYDGKRWAKDATGAIQQLAKETVRSIYLEASQEPNENKRIALGKHAKQSETAASIRNMIFLAQSEPGIPISPSQLDSNDWLFNCSNGTIDLKTGELLPHNPGDLTTKLSPVEYNPEATSPLFESFLEQVTGGNSELIAFLQKMVGYSLTGNTGEEKLFFLHGPGATGKSTFIEAIKATLGDYASTADFESFTKKPSGSGVRNDIARLNGVRFVSSVEVEDGKHLAEALIKSLTGGDKVTTRFLFQEFFEFHPKFKLILAANHKPRLKYDDDAIWRRILQVPFDKTIPEDQRDPQMKAQLKDTAFSGPAILAWAVKGCLEWQREGLRVPALIQEATEAYREENDPLKEFLEDKCCLAPTYWIPCRDLHQEYVNWAKANGVRFPLDQRAFGSHLKARGFEQSRHNSGKVRGWEGIDIAGPGDTVTQGDAEIEQPGA